VAPNNGASYSHSRLGLGILLGLCGAVGTSAAEQLASIDAKHVQVGGEIGRRIDVTIHNNVFRIDNDAVFLESFRNKNRADFSYVGLGKHLDALARLAYHTQDEKLIALKDGLIGELIKTQLPSGYVGIFESDHMVRWWDLHETSYIVFGFVSDYRHFGNRASLEAARKLADYMMQVRPKRPIEVHVSTIGFERAFIALYEATGDRAYLEHVTMDDALRNWHGEIDGHAYDYLSVCMAQLDLYRLKADPRLLRQSKRVVDYMLAKDGMAVVGTGSNHERWHNDQTSSDKFGETCFTAYWLRLLDRLMQIEGDSLYGDLMERAIYNALFAAQSRDGRELRKYTPFEGRREFYQGEQGSDFQRDAYCCPNNFRRIVAELPNMIYYRCGDGLAVNLYTPSEASIELESGVWLKTRQVTDYPNSGEVAIHLDLNREREFPLRLRIPRWCQGASVSVNGKIAGRAVEGGRFFTIDRKWRTGDRVDVNMPMTARLVRGRKAQCGRVAVLRGPLLFCLNPDRQEKASGKTAADTTGEAPLEAIRLEASSLHAPVRDETVRPGGLACRARAWSPGRDPGRPANLTLILTEYADAGGQATYFLVDAANVAVDDELVKKKPGQ